VLLNVNYREGAAERGAIYDRGAFIFRVENPKTSAAGSSQEPRRKSPQYAPIKVDPWLIQLMQLGAVHFLKFNAL
jgi:hypothetical protein